MTPLKKYKQSRIIIFTSHYMDEAEFFGDRVGKINEVTLTSKQLDFHSERAVLSKNFKLQVAMIEKRLMNKNGSTLKKLANVTCLSIIEKRTRSKNSKKEKKIGSCPKYAVLRVLSPNNISLNCIY